MVRALHSGPALAAGPVAGETVRDKDRRELSKLFRLKEELSELDERDERRMRALMRAAERELLEVCTYASRLVLGQRFEAVMAVLVCFPCFAPDIGALSSPC